MNRYNSKSMSNLSKEFNEIIIQNQAIKKRMMKTDPNIADCIEILSKNKRMFLNLLQKSKIEKIKRGMNIDNIDMNKKYNLSKDLKNESKIDRPILLKYKSNYHLLTGENEVSNIGYGIESYVIDVSNLKKDDEK